MGAMRKVILKPEQQYIEDTLRENRCQRETLNINKIIFDVKYQARLLSIDMDHVHELAVTRDRRGEPFDPLVVFRHPITDELKCVDGWHRAEEARQRGERTIVAYVIKGDDHEALLYATMCNQVTLLTRKREDIDKAIGMLLSDEQCSRWNDSMIARHVGCDPSTVATRRVRYYALNNIPVPRKAIPPAPSRARPGKVPKRSAAAVTAPTFAPPDPDVYPLLRVEDVPRRQSLDRNALVRYFIGQDVLLEMPEVRGTPAEVHALGGLLAREGPGCACVALASDDPEDFALAVGRVLLFRRWLRRDYADDGGMRAVVICDPEDQEDRLLEYGRALGVEFLTPQALLESLSSGAGVSA
jgi:hypothetical protein